jgi:hypothetical protein
MTTLEADTCLCDAVDYDPDNEALTLQESYCEEDDAEPDEEVNVDDYNEDNTPDIIEISPKQPLKVYLLACLNSKSCTMLLYLTILLMLVTSIVAIIVVSIIVVEPYYCARTFLPTLCDPVSTVTKTANRRCSCGKGCQSRFPCIVITVRIGTDDDTPWTAMMAHDESMLDRQVLFMA